MAGYHVDCSVLEILERSEEVDYCHSIDWSATRGLLVRSFKQTETLSLKQDGFILFRPAREVEGQVSAGVLLEACSC